MVIFMESGIFTRKEVAALFNVCPVTIWHWEQKGILKPVFYLNGRPQYHIDDIAKVPENRQAVYRKPTKKANG